MLELLDELRNSVGILRLSNTKLIPNYERLDDRNRTFRDVITALHEHDEIVDLEWTVDCYTDASGNLGEYQSSAQCESKYDPGFRYYVVLEETSLNQLLNYV